MTVKVKICGITTVDDGIAAVEAGADAIGLVFYPKSPRNVSLTQALHIAAEVPPFVTVTALVMNADDGLVRDVCSIVKPDLLQFHGNESREFCEQFGMHYIKAVKGGHGGNVLAAAEDFSSARGLLVDAHAGSSAGGSGETFDWKSVNVTRISKPVILAGGLAPENVHEAVLQVRPYAVDVSSGVESAPGVKDHAKMRAFVLAAKNA